MSESACWCDDKSNEPCDGICRLLRDHGRLEGEVGRLAMENAALRTAESHQLATARAELAALREAAQAVVGVYDVYPTRGWRELAVLKDALRAVLASSESGTR